MALKLLALMAIISQLCVAQRTGSPRGAYWNRDTMAIQRAVEEGRYKEGAALVKEAAERIHATDQEPGIVNCYAAMADFWLEVGLPQHSIPLLAVAKRVDDTAGFSPILWGSDPLRVRAALRLDAGEYQGAFEDAVEPYDKGKRAPLNAVGAYRIGIAAQAKMRMGNLSQANELMIRAIGFVPKKQKRSLFYVPRLLYSACLVESHQGKFVEAEEHCRRGLSFVEPYGVRSRDVSLGYLALAETLLLKTDLPEAREAVNKSIGLTRDMFGGSHQDLVEGLKLLALIASREAKADEAKRLASEARKMAITVFGEESTSAGVLTDALKSIDTPASHPE